MSIVTRFKILLLLGSLTGLLLLGGAARAASISISPSGEIDFTAHSGDTASQTLTVSNLTSLPLYVTIRISGNGASDFSASDTTFQLAGMALQNVTLRFMPGAGTGLDTATLHVMSSMLDTLKATLVGHATTTSFQITPEGTLVLNGQVGSTAADTLRLQNLGSSSLSFTATLSGTNAALFSVSAPSFSLMGDSSRSLIVRFTPLVSGTDTAFLTVMTSAGDSERLTVIGHAMPLVSFSLTPSSTMVFNARVGVADTEMLTVRNTTAAALPLTLSLSGSNDFSTNLTSVTVAANGSTMIPIVFKSNTAGTFNGKLSVSSLTGDTGSVALVGHATSSNEFELNVPDEVNFSTRVGQTECLPIRIANNTSGAVAISGLTVGGTSSSDFHFSGSSSFNIAANSTDTITVCFAPTATSEDELHGTLTFQFAGVIDTSLKGTETIQLNGSVEGQEGEGDSLFFLTTRNIEFNNVLVGTTQCQTIQISNPTASAVTVDSATISGLNSTSFTITGASMLTVAPHSTQYVDVCFSPTVAMQEENLTITLVTTSTLGTSNVVVRVEANAIDSMNNNGELSNCISVRHEQGVLGPIILGGKDTSAIFLTNRTNNQVTINSASISGSGSSAFTVTNTFPITLQAGGQGQLMVAFNPTANGAPSFGATITLNATDSCGAITIHVEGVAVPGRLGRGDRDTSDIDLGTELTGNGTSVVTIANPKASVQACVIDTITLTNTTSSSMTINNILIPTNPNIILIGTSMTTPITLASGQSVSAYVQFCGMGTVGQVFTQPLFIATNQSIQPQMYTIQAVDPPAASVAEQNPVIINFAIMPNPSAGEVSFNLPGAATANIEIYDVLGNLVATTQGTSKIEWNGENAAGSPLASGQYIVRVTGTDTQGQPYRASREIVIQH